ncbi:hypothetical protein [Haloglomus litoreum]|uniref:hypothetical protein n=1 Tax=Haloglomus litoreum TaxID=3034026 RepID=UPI0023E8B077|nr:hypothetical protein [Haloglomus sp. DT116]
MDGSRLRAAVRATPLRTALVVVTVLSTLSRPSLPAAGSDDGRDRLRSPLVRE